jgi:hypothetical protein
VEGQPNNNYGSRILYTSSESGRTHLYDADVGSTTTVPTVKRRKGHCCK